MRCLMCEFENMPGVKTCFRCGSVLEADKPEIDITPPRAPSAKKNPFAYLGRQMSEGFLRRNAATSRRINRLSEGTRGFVFAFGSFLMSLIPGLAHAMQRRFKSVRIPVIIWLVLIVLSLLLHATGFGILLMGLAVGLHAWIASDGATLIRAGQRFVLRVLGLFLASLVMLVIYRGAGSLIFIDITGIYAGAAMPHHRIQPGDYLLARRSSARAELLSRGSMVVIPSTRIIMIYERNEYSASTGSGEDIVAQIVGLPGETVRMTDGQFTVNGTELDSERYPVPEWLVGRDAAVILPERTYFVASEYRLSRGRGAGLTDELIQQVCTAKEESMRARVFMRWLPLRRRGWLKGQ